jgi:LysM repeat protein
VTRSRSPARYVAPAAFLAAVTVAALLIRSGLDSRQSSVPAPASTLRTSVTTTAPPAATTTNPATTAPAQGETYEIRAGDTLDKIAIAFDTTVEQLLVLNPEVDPNSLQLGQTIRVK